MKKTLTVLLILAAIMTLFVSCNDNIAEGLFSDSKLSEYFRFTATSGTVVISNGKKGSSVSDVNLEYTKDGKTWNVFVMETGDGDATKITLNAGETVYFRAKSTNTAFASDISNYRFFTTTTENSGTVTVSGNIMYLLDSTGESRSLNDCAFVCLFDSCKCITDASALSLPATTLAQNCYCNMFSGCENLTTAPELPAENLVTLCYQAMFSDCTSLTVAPVLPAKTLATYCYLSMFSNCINLSSVTMLATDVSASLCLGGFLNNAGTEEGINPILYVDPSMAGNETITAQKGNFTVMDKGNTFRFTATSGTVTISNGINGTAPAVELEYTKDGKTWNDFVMETGAGDATKITLNAGDSVYFRAKSTNTAFASSVSKYRYFTTTSEDDGKVSVSGNIMYLLDSTGESRSLNDNAFFMLFANCKCITDAGALSLPATELAKSCYKAMFYGCTSLASAPALTATILAESCYFYMFFNCTSLASAPALPATTLAGNCYCSMFSGCTSLTEAPVLPAKVLAKYCYQTMFMGCSKLSSVTMLATDVSATYCLENFLKEAGTGATNPKLYVDSSMTTNETITAKKGCFTVAAYQN